MPDATGPISASRSTPSSSAETWSIVLDACSTLSARSCTAATSMAPPCGFSASMLMSVAGMTAPFTSSSAPVEATRTAAMFGPMMGTHSAERHSASSVFARASAVYSVSSAAAAFAPSSSPAAMRSCVSVASGIADSSAACVANALLASMTPHTTNPMSTTRMPIGTHSRALRINGRLVSRLGWSPEQ